MCKSPTKERNKYRNVVRFLTVLAIPWFGDVLEEVVGFELEIEVELIVFLSFFVLGSFWCGWLCPFGNISYFISKFGHWCTKLFQWRVNKNFSFQFNLPNKIDKPMRYLKYFCLFLLLYVIYNHNENYFFSDHGDMYDSNRLSVVYLSIKQWAILLIPFLFLASFVNIFVTKKQHII